MTPDPRLYATTAVRVGKGQVLDMLRELTVRRPDFDGYGWSEDDGYGWSEDDVADLELIARAVKSAIADRRPKASRGETWKFAVKRP